jgi:large subunit ribosomal protein L5
MPRLKEQYRAQVVPAMMEEYKYQSLMQVPRLEKIVVNIGLGEAMQNAKVLDAATEDLRAITGQQPVITRARKSIAAYKLRAGRQIGAGCGISWIGCAMLHYLVVATFAVCHPTRSTDVETIRWDCASSWCSQR